MSTLPPSYTSLPIPTLTSPAAGQQRSWFARNWKWLVPGGCLTLLLAFAAFVGCIFGAVMFSLRHSAAYDMAMTKVRASQTVAQKIGSPIKVSWFISGSINVNTTSGNADLAIPIFGPKGKATVYAVAKKSSGDWQMTTLQVDWHNKSQERLDLLKPDPTEQIY